MSIPSSHSPSDLKPPTKTHSLKVQHLPVAQTEDQAFSTQVIQKINNTVCTFRLSVQVSHLSLGTDKNQHKSRERVKILRALCMDLLMNAFFSWFILKELQLEIMTRRKKTTRTLSYPWTQLGKHKLCLVINSV